MSVKTGVNPPQGASETLQALAPPVVARQLAHFPRLGAWLAGTAQGKEAGKARSQTGKEAGEAGEETGQGALMARMVGEKKQKPGSNAGLFAGCELRGGGTPDDWGGV